MANNDLAADAEPFPRTTSEAGETVQLTPASSVPTYRHSETALFQSAIHELQQSSYSPSVNTPPCLEPGDHQQQPDASPMTRSGPESHRPGNTIQGVSLPCPQNLSTIPQTVVRQLRDEEEFQSDLIKGVHPTALERYHHERSSSNQVSSSEQLSLDIDIEKLKSLKLETKSTEEISDEDIEKYRHLFPDDLKLDYYDAMILYHEDDKEAVQNFVRRVETDVKLHKVYKPRIVLFDDIMPNSGMMLTGQLDFVLPYCTYVLLYVTKKFCSDEGWSRFSSQTCLMEAIHNPERRWTVVPIFTESKRKNTFNAPPSIRSLKGIQYLSDDKFHVDSMRKLLEDKLYVRLDNEKEHKSKRKIFILKRKGDEKRDDARRRQKEVQAADEEHLRMEAFREEMRDNARRRQEKIQAANEERLHTEEFKYTLHPIKIEDTPQEAMKNLNYSGWSYPLEPRSESENYMKFLMSQYSDPTLRPVGSQSVPANMNYLSSSPSLHHSISTSPDDLYSLVSKDKTASMTGLSYFPSLDSYQAKPQFTLGADGSQSKPRFSGAVKPQQGQHPYENAGTSFSQQHSLPEVDRHFSRNAPAQNSMTASFPQSCGGLESKQEVSRLYMLPKHYPESLHQSLPGPGGDKNQRDTGFSSMPPILTTAQPGSSPANQPMSMAARASEQSPNISGFNTTKEAKNLADTSGEHQQQLAVPRDRGDGISFPPQQPGTELPENVTEDFPPESQVCQGQSHLGPGLDNVKRIRHVGQPYISEAMSQPPLVIHGPGHHASARAGNQVSPESTVNPYSERPVTSVSQNHQQYPQRPQYVLQPGQRGPEDHWHVRTGAHPQHPYQPYSPYRPEHLHQPYDPHGQNFIGGRFYNSSQLYSQVHNINPFYAGYTGQQHHPHYQQPLPPLLVQPPLQQFSQPGYPQHHPEHQPPTVHYHYYNQGEKVPTTTINNISIKSAEHVNVANEVAVRAESEQAGILRNDNQHYAPTGEPTLGPEMMSEGQSAGEIATRGASSLGSQHSSPNVASRLTDTVTADLRSQQSSQGQTPEIQPSQQGFRDLLTMFPPPDSQTSHLSSPSGLAQGGQQLDQWCRDYERDQETELKRFITGPPGHASLESCKDNTEDETQLKCQGSSK